MEPNIPAANLKVQRDVQHLGYAPFLMFNASIDIPFLDYGHITVVTGIQSQ